MKNLTNETIYQIFDVVDQAVVFTSTWGERKAVQRKAERMNQDYGAVRFVTRIGA